jgi:hypothetical protein
MPFLKISFFYFDQFCGGVTIDKMFKIFGPIFEQNANINYEPTFEKSVNFGPIFEKNANFGRIFEKSVNFEDFVNGR